MHYYQFNIGDYAKRTRHLSNTEDLAYRRLLDIYYLDESPLENNIKKLSRLIGLSSSSADIENILCDFFTLTDGHWTHSRADKEILSYHQKADAARENGKKGGRPKKPNPNPSITQSVNLANPEETQPKANHKPLTINQEPLNNNKEKINKKNRGSRLSQDWKPSIDLINFCNNERPDLNIQKVASSFLDYWIAQPGQKGVKLNWDATWRNWVRNTRKEFTQQAKPEKFSVYASITAKQEAWRKQNEINVTGK